MKDTQDACRTIILGNTENVVEESAWLLEIKLPDDEGLSRYPKFDPATEQIKFTRNPYEAIRFPREEDAQAIKKVFWHQGIIHVTDPKTIEVNEHRWVQTIPIENPNHKKAE